MKYKTLINFIRDIYGTNEPIPLHAPLFIGNESTYVKETIDSNFVSSVGKFVSDFEADLAKFTGSPRAVAVCSGTAALHTSLVLCEIKRRLRYYSIHHICSNLQFNKYWELSQFS